MWRSGMRKRAIVSLILLAVLSAALLAYAALSARALCREYAGVSVRIADTPLPGKKLKTLVKENGDATIALTAAWTRAETADASAPTMETTARLRSIAVYGDMRQVAPMRLVSGSYPAEDDYDGCLLDVKSAESLFHSIDAAGMKILIDGAFYTVRGVVDGGEPMALLRSLDAAYENLEFSVSALSDGKAAVDGLLYQYALSADYAIVQNGLYARMLNGLIWLPVALMLLVTAAKLICLASKACRIARKGKGVLFFALAAACIAGTIAILKLSFFWPQIYLPTKCSDFAFWGKLVKSWREDWNTLLLITPLSKDIGFYAIMRRLACCAAALAAGLAGLESALACLMRLPRKGRAKEDTSLPNA